MNTDFSQPFNPEAYAPSGKADMRFRRYVEKGMPWFYGIVFPVILGFCLYTYEKRNTFPDTRTQPLLTGQYFLSYARGISGRHVAMGSLFPHAVFLLPGCRNSPSHSRLGLHLLRHALGLQAFPFMEFSSRLGTGRPVGRHRGDGLFHLLYQITRLFLHGLHWHTGGPVGRMGFQPYSPPEPILGLRVDDRMASRRLSFIRGIRIGRHGLHGSALLAYAGHAI